MWYNNIDHGSTLLYDLGRKIEWDYIDVSLLNDIVLWVCNMMSVGKNWNLNLLCYILYYK